MRNEIIGIAMLVAAFGFGYLLGVRRADWQLKEATKRIDNAINLMRGK